MRRRAFLTCSGTGALAAMAGCLDSGPLTGSTADTHPFAGETVRARVEDESTTDHDVTQNASEALQFWATESTQYAGFQVDFEVTDAEDAPFVIRYRDDPSGCDSIEGDSTQVLGCAPLLEPNDSVPDPVVAYVVAGDRPYGQIRTTTKHEIGHVLGLGHDDDPREIMSNRPADRIPLYDRRVDIWERVIDGSELANDGLEVFQSGVERWNDEEYERARSDFEAAREDFRQADEQFATSNEQTAAFEGGPGIETVDLPRLRETLGQLESRMEAAVSFATHMVDATTAAVEDDPAQADRFRDRANEDIRTFRELPSPELRTVAVALGLVRGFDRDEDVIEGDDIDDNSEG